MVDIGRVLDQEVEFLSLPFGMGWPYKEHPILWKGCSVILRLGHKRYIASSWPCLEAYAFAALNLHMRSSAMLRLSSGDTMWRDHIEIGKDAQGASVIPDPSGLGIPCVDTWHKRGSLQMFLTTKERVWTSGDPVRISNRLQCSST